MTIPNTTYSHAQLLERLTALSRQKVSAFAASCAERLLPTYIRYSEKACLGAKQSQVYRDALDMIWRCVTGEDVDRQSIDEIEQICLSAIPSEDDAWQVGEPYAEDAGAAVVFAIRTWRFCDPQEAVWAAQRILDAIDNYAGQNYPPNQHHSPDTLTERELARQDRDLRQLEEPTEPSVVRSGLQEIRIRAQQEASFVFSDDAIAR